MATPGFFAVVKDDKAQKLYFRRVSSPRDSGHEVYWLEDKAVAALGAAVDVIIYGDLVALPAALKGETTYALDYKAAVVVPPVVVPPAPTASVKAKAPTITGKKVSDAIPVADIFDFTNSTAADYTITANPAASADLTTTPGSVVLAATGDVNIIATNTKDKTITATAAITGVTA